MSCCEKKNGVGGAIIGLTALLSTVIFLYVGFTLYIWHPTWLIFLSIPIVSSIVDAVTKKNVAGRVSGLISLICIVTYLYIGFFHNLWHPGWLIFFAIPIVHIIVKLFTGETSSPCAQDTEKQNSKDE